MAPIGPSFSDPATAVSNITSDRSWWSSLSRLGADVSNHLGLLLIVALVCIHVFLLGYLFVVMSNQSAGSRRLAPITTPSTGSASAFMNSFGMQRRNKNDMKAD